MIKSFFKISFRRVLNHPAFSIINVLGLAIGLACFIIIMLWVKFELSYDKFHENSDRIFRVAFTNDKGEYHGYYQTGKLASYLKDEFPEISQSTSFMGGQCKIANETKGFYCTGSYVDSSFFKMFSFPFIYGDVATSLKQPKTLVITESLALKLFNNENPLGKIVKINEIFNYTVSGVIKDIPNNSDIKFDLLMPFCDAQDWMKTWNSKWTQTYVMLQNKEQFEDVNKKISGVMNLFQPQWNNILYLFPLSKSHLYDLNGGGLITYIWIFTIMAIIVLLVACVNYMNLSTSRSALRNKEIFIKKITGSKSSHISLQFLTEAILLSGVSLIIAILIAKFTLPFINNLLNSHIGLELNIANVFTLILLAFITGLIAGSYPSFYLSGIRPNRIIQNSVPKSGRKKINFNNMLIVFQFTISIFFISCTLLVTNQLNYIQTKDIGLKKTNIIKLSTLGKLQEKSIELKQELLKNPAIENVTVSNTNLTSWNNSGPLEWDGKDKNELTEIGYNWVDYDFLETFKLRMKEGRFFSKEFISDQGNSFIINEKAVDYLKLKNPVGMKVKSWFGVEGTIIGVIQDFNTSSLHDELGPIALLASEKENFMFIAIKGNELSNTLKFIDQKVKELVPDDPYDHQFLDDHIKYLYQTEALTGKLSMSITLLAIFISCLGLWGLVLSTIKQRIKEIGIRKVNGAKVLEILTMLNKDFVKWVIIAFIIATPFAYYAMHQWLENFAYKTELSWWVFALAGLLALIVALLTVSWQSWKAARRNPVEALRYE